MRRSIHIEKHNLEKSGWLRAAVLGANDGIISVTSLVIGVVASGAGQQTIFITCLAGLISGAISMAAGEYISVKSQADIEEADLALERRELEKNPEQELKELTLIYIHRGLDEKLAHEVAVQLTAHDSLAAHARDEIGISEMTVAKPLQAAFSSALSFSVGAVIPLLAVLFAPQQYMANAIVVTAIFSLLGLGALASYTAGSPILKGALRVLFWGCFAMLITSAIGSLFNVNVA
jgi:VIT1/CCC1 family predicted Fe2+/Mn2+ transporter